MGNPRLFKFDAALKELARRQEALDLAKNLSGLSKEARALYEARLERMGISVAKLQRFIESEGARGQFGNKREFTADMISGGTEGHTIYRLWADQGINWALQEAHHGGGGLAVQEAIGHLPPAKQYAVLQELAESGRFPGQQQGKGMFPLIPGLHQQNPSSTGSKGLTPLDMGSRGQSSHGMPGTKLILNPNDSVATLVKQISAHMDEFDAVNDAKLLESNRILSVIKELPEDQQVKALQQTLDDPKGLTKIYGFAGGEMTSKPVAQSGGKTIYETTSTDGSRTLHAHDPTLGGKKAWKWINPKNAIKLGLAIGTPTAVDVLYNKGIAEVTEKASGGQKDKSWLNIAKDYAVGAKDEFVQSLPTAAAMAGLASLGGGSALAIGAKALAPVATTLGLDAAMSGLYRGIGVTGKDDHWSKYQFHKTKEEVQQINQAQVESAKLSGGPDYGWVDTVNKVVKDPLNELEYLKNQAIQGLQSIFNY